jgi:hypothetical protein
MACERLPRARDRGRLGAGEGRVRGSSSKTPSVLEMRSYDPGEDSIRDIRDRLRGIRHAEREHTQRTSQGDIRAMPRHEFVSEAYR